MDPLTMSTISMTVISLLYGGAVLSGLGVWDDIFDDSSSGSATPTAASAGDSPDFADTVAGGEGHDLLTTTLDNIFFDAGGGDDTIDASAGNDLILGGAGDDDIQARPGDDTVDGGIGADTVDGGYGDDSIDGGAGNDVLSGAADDDLVDGGAGDDTLSGSSGSDTLLGGAGNDLLNGYIAGQAVSGNPNEPDAADRLEGGAGDDTLILGGDDTGFGGEGRDSFILHKDIQDNAPAVIGDFARGDDWLVVEYQPQFDDDGNAIDPVLEVGQTEDGESAQVRLDGVLRAIVDGQPDLTVDDISLSAVP